MVIDGTIKEKQVMTEKQKLFNWVKDKSIEPIQAYNYIKDTKRLTQKEKDILTFKIKLLEKGM